jgi:hypothetical protein
MKGDTDTVVVKPHYRTEDAYDKGYDRFEDAETLHGEEPDLSHFYSSATHANHVLPSLRAMAGFEDTAGGCYTKEREVAVIHPGCEEDEPAPADLMSSQYVFEHYFEAWQMGAYDALEGRDRYHTDLPQW